jgi:putative transposase
MKFISRGLEVKVLCKWAKIERSSFYYKPMLGKPGKKPSEETLFKSKLVGNDQVLVDIREIVSQEYCIYGYHNVTLELKTLGYLINKKKVYRLMKEDKLLNGKVIKTKGRRQFVRYRRIEATRPMQYLCLDIKYVWVQGDNRWYYQLAVMDVFSRMIVGWIFQASIKQRDVIALMRRLHLQYNLKGVIIRNDNGSQFIANQVRQALQDLEAKQEFTHVATPEENSYIEAFHSIEQKELIDRYNFESFYDAKNHIYKYMRWYNNIRRHGQLKGLTPVQKWAQGWAWSLVRQQFEPASDDMSRPDSAAKWAASAPYSLDLLAETDYLCLNSEQASMAFVANQIVKRVQRIGG